MEKEIEEIISFASLKKTQNMPLVGIDFGTTNSAVAVYNESKDELISSDYEPTLLYFEEGNESAFHLGESAITQYLASGLQGRFIRSIKSILHASTFKFTYIQGRKYTAENLVALILKKLKNQAEELSGMECEQVVIGRPARFSPDPEKDALAQDRLYKAALQAGFKTIRFQLEPIAAAFAYEREIEQEELVLVGDLGGGTSDFTIMRLGSDLADKSDRRQDILGTSGVRVGGDDFDAEIAWHKIVHHLGYGMDFDPGGRGKILTIPPHHYRAFCRWEKHFLLNSPKVLRELDNYYRATFRHPKIADFITVLKNNLGYSIFRSIEAAKISLSNRDQAKISFNGSGIKIKETLKVPEFGETIQSQTQLLDETMDKLLAEVGLSPSQINSVFLTGGSSLVGPVRDLFIQKFGAEKIRSKDAFTSVAKGLALQGRYL